MRGRGSRKKPMAHSRGPLGTGGGGSSSGFSEFPLLPDIAKAHVASLLDARTAASLACCSKDLRDIVTPFLGRAYCCKACGRRLFTTRAVFCPHGLPGREKGSPDAEDWPELAGEQGAEEPLLGGSVRGQGLGDGGSGHGRGSLSSEGAPGGALFGGTMSGLGGGSSVGGRDRAQPVLVLDDGPTICIETCPPALAPTHHRVFHIAVPRRGVGRLTTLDICLLEASTVHCSGCRLFLGIHVSSISSLKASRRERLQQLQAALAREVDDARDEESDGTSEDTHEEEGREEEEDGREGVTGGSQTLAGIEEGEGAPSVQDPMLVQSGGACARTRSQGAAQVPCGGDRPILLEPEVAGSYGSVNKGEGFLAASEGPGERARRGLGDECPERDQDACGGRMLSEPCGANSGEGVGRGLRAWEDSDTESALTFVVGKTFLVRRYITFEKLPPYSSVSCSCFTGSGVPGPPQGTMTTTVSTTPSTFTTTISTTAAGAEAPADESHSVALLAAQACLECTGAASFWEGALSTSTGSSEVFPLRCSGGSSRVYRFGRLRGDGEAKGKGRQCGNLLSYSNQVLSTHHCWDAGRGVERAMYVNALRPRSFVEEKSEKAELSQGRMVVAHVKCAQCDTAIGWKFCDLDCELPTDVRNVNQVGRFGIVQSAVDGGECLFQNLDGGVDSDEETGDVEAPDANVPLPEAQATMFTLSPSIPRWQPSWSVRALSRPLSFALPSVT